MGWIKEALKKYFQPKLATEPVGLTLYDQHCIQCHGYSLETIRSLRRLVREDRESLRTEEEAFEIDI